MGLIPASSTSGNDTFVAIKRGKVHFPAPRRDVRQCKTGGAPTAPTVQRKDPAAEHSTKLHISAINCVY